MIWLNHEDYGTKDNPPIDHSFVLGGLIYVVFYEELKSKFSFAYIRPDNLALTQTNVCFEGHLPISIFVFFFVYENAVYMISPQNNYRIFKGVQRSDASLNFTEMETKGNAPEYDRSMKSPFIRRTETSTLFCELTIREAQVIYLDQFSFETMRWNRIEFEHNQLALIAFSSGGSWKGITGRNGLVYFNFVQTLMGRAKGGPDFVILDCTRRVCEIGVQSHYFPLPARKFLVEGRIYAFDDRNIFRFEESTNTWKKIKLPFSDRVASFYSSVSVIGSRIYLIGGSNGLFASSGRLSPSPSFVPVVSVIETVPSLADRAVASINSSGFVYDEIRRHLPKRIFELYFRNKSDDGPFPKGLEFQMANFQPTMTQVEDRTTR